MTAFDCSLRESLQVGRDIRLQITGRVDEVLYVFIDAAARHELGGVGGFHASAPLGIGRTAHVLALREVRLCIDLGTTQMQVTREPPSRKFVHLHRSWVEGASC